jgi:hypothetical protein
LQDQRSTTQIMETQAAVQAAAHVAQAAQAAPAAPVVPVICKRNGCKNTLRQRSGLCASGYCRPCSRECNPNFYCYNCQRKYDGQPSGNWGPACCVVNVSMKLPHNHPVANAMDVGNLIFFYEI